MPKRPHWSYDWSSAAAAFNCRKPARAAGHHPPWVAERAPQAGTALLIPHNSKRTPSIKNGPHCRGRAEHAAFLFRLDGGPSSRQPVRTDRGLEQFPVP